MLTYNHSFVLPRLSLSGWFFRSPFMSSFKFTAEGMKKNRKKWLCSWSFSVFFNFPTNKIELIRLLDGDLNGF